MNQHVPVTGDASASRLVRMAYDDLLTFGWRVRALLELRKTGEPQNTSEDDMFCLVNLGLYLRDKHGARTCHDVCMYLDGTLDWPTSLLLALPSYFNQKENEFVASLLASDVNSLLPRYQARHKDAIEAFRKQVAARPVAKAKPALRLSPQAEQVLAERVRGTTSIAPTAISPKPKKAVACDDTTTSPLRSQTRVLPVPTCAKPPLIASAETFSPQRDAIVAPAVAAPAQPASPLSESAEAVKTAPAGTVETQPVTVIMPPQEALPSSSTAAACAPLDPRLVHILDITNATTKKKPLNDKIRQLRIELEIPHTELAQRLKDAGFYPTKSVEQVRALVNNTLAGLIKWTHHLMQGLLVVFQLSADDMVKKMTFL